MSGFDRLIGSVLLAIAERLIGGGGVDWPQSDSCEWVQQIEIDWSGHI